MSNSLEIVKVLIYTVLSFLVALTWTPSLIRLLRWLRFWKKEKKNINVSGTKFTDPTLIKFFDHTEVKIKIPRGGGLVIWVTAMFLATCFWILLKADPSNKLFQYLNFVSRSQTFIPLGTLFFGAILGFVDDALATLESGGNYKAGGLKLSQRIGFITLFSTIIGLWFYLQNKITILSFFGMSFDLSNLGGLNLTWLIIPITVVILNVLWTSSVIDGFDGLAGSVFVPIFITFAAISYIKGYYDIAVLMGVLSGATMAFLWFNISPAKFYMGDTGSTPLLLTLGVVAILTDTLYLLPIAGITLMATTFGNIIQVSSKKIFKRKVFHAAPIHHHFESIGLKRDQIVFRYSLITIGMCTLSIAIALLLR